MVSWCPASTIFAWLSMMYWFPIEPFTQVMFKCCHTPASGPADPISNAQAQYYNDAIRTGRLPLGHSLRKCTSANCRNSPCVTKLSQSGTSSRESVVILAPVHQNQNAIALTNPPR